MVVVASRSPDVVLLLLAAVLLLLLAFTATGVATSTKSSNICDRAECGRGTCSEVPGPIPVFSASYKCNCDPGWSQPKLLNFSLVTLAPFLPCIVPDCLLDSSCYNFTMFDFRGIPITDICVIMDCGYGECKGAGLFSYSCECQPGYGNFLNSTAFPCVKDCSLGDACSKQGIVPPPEPSPSAAPPTGSVSSWRLLQQLLSLAILLLLQVV